MQEKKTGKGNPLAWESEGRLLVKFAVPSIISFLVSALYNIVDQIFIGQGVGLLGNAATNVAFPLTTISLSIALLLGVGSASNFNLELGAKEEEKAGRIVGSGASMMIIAGAVLCAVVVIFLEPLLRLFGATDQVFDYAVTYTRITSLGLPFFILSTGGSHIIRADGKPTYSMICMMTGAIINTILDPLFIFVFGMGMAGAALATVIGQVVSGILVIRYLFRFQSVVLKREYFKPAKAYISAITSLGAAACFNQLAMTLVQITMNNTLKFYGATSSYGSEIPLACVGIITKVNTVLMAFIIGISQGCQPIAGFNFGAKNYSRVKKVYFQSIVAASCIATLACLGFQLFPRNIISIFGDGSEAYFHFGEQYFRIFLLLTFVNALQPVTSNFFTSIGKAKMGIFLSMTRQVIFLLPLIIVFPIFMGIDGIMYAGPIADGAAAILAIVLIIREMKRISTLVRVKAQPNIS